MNTLHEICIAGGGPAGIATALSLNKRGVPCTVIEAAATVRPKVGETLPPGVLPVLHALNIDFLLNVPEHAVCYGNSWIWGSDEIQDKHFMMHAGGNGWHLKRDVFECQLLEEAEKRGVQVIRNAKIMQAETDENGKWKLQIKSGAKDIFHTCKILVDATGRNSKIARCLGLERQSYDALVGVVARFALGKDIQLSHQTNIESNQNGWWYAAALAGGEIVTAFMTDANLLSRDQLQVSGYWNSLQQTKLIRSLFPADFHPSDNTVLQVQSAETSFLEKVYGENWVAVGDAAYAYDPVSSYGITSALGTGFYAGNAIADHIAGAAEAFPAYAYLAGKAFADYLPLWKHQYGMERRWEEAAFWRNRL